MEVTLALLADAANMSDGKLNILGTFDALNATAFPVRHPEMMLVMRFEAPPAEYDSQKRLDIKLIDADGDTLGGVEGQIQIGKAEHGRTLRLQHILTIRDIVFPRPGDYVFAILIDGRTEAQVPVQLIDISEGATT